MNTDKPRLLTFLDIFSGILLTAAVLMVFLYAPVERTMGAVQKVFYFHVSTAWVGMLGFMAAAVVGVLYLATRKIKWDLAGYAAVEISLVFFLIAIISGSIWARPTWNTWWTWDPRLTTAAIVELIYAAYLLLRAGVDDPARRARFSAVYAVFGFFSVPLTFIAIRLLRTIHPVVVGGSNPGSEGSFSMVSPMKQTFFFSLFAFSVIFIDLFWHRIRLEKVTSKIEELRIQLMD